MAAQTDADRLTEDEFKVGFFQGYADWDLSGYLGAGADFWLDDTEKGLPISNAPTAGTEEVGETKVVVVDPTHPLSSPCSVFFLLFFD